MSAPKYRYRHEQLRKALLPQAWGTACHLCGRPMLRGQLLDLDYALDGQSYGGMAHARCNRSQGARLGAAMRAAKRQRRSIIFPTRKETKWTH